MVAVNYLWNPINDNIVREFDDAGATVAEYTTEPDVYGNVVSQYRNGQTSYLHSDGQGNTTELTIDVGTVTDTIRYSAFGEIMERSGMTEIPFQYVGQKGYCTDGLTGQILVRRRPYEPARARWLAVDPREDFAGSGYVVFNELHEYTYSRNSPLVRIDPLGTQSIVFAPTTEEGGGIKPDPTRRCWTREEWQKKCKDRGELPPGHDPKEFPKDYPGLPEGYGDPRPIWWGTEIARGKDLSGRMPGDDEVDRGTENCVCISPYTAISRMRPKGKMGKWPVPGQSVVDCEVGEQVLMTYPAVCKGKNDDPCKGPWDPECVKKKCLEYVLYQCAMRGGVTRWVDARLKDKPSTIRTKCK